VSDDKPAASPKPDAVEVDNMRPSTPSGVWRAVEAQVADVQHQMKSKFVWSDIKTIAAIIIAIIAAAWAAYGKVEAVASAAAQTTVQKTAEQADATQRELVRYENVNDASVLGVKADVQEVRNAQAETQSDIRALYRFMQTKQPQPRLEKPAPKPKPPSAVVVTHSIDGGVLVMIDGGVNIDAGP